MNGQDICLEALLQLLNTGVKLIYNKLVSAFSRFLCHYQGAFSRLEFCTLCGGLQGLE